MTIEFYVSNPDTTLTKVKYQHNALTGLYDVFANGSLMESVKVNANSRRELLEHVNDTYYVHSMVQ